MPYYWGIDELLWSASSQESWHWKHISGESTVGHVFIFLGQFGCRPDGNLILKGNVYRIVPKSEVACPKKDSITASNWGRFLPGLQIKSPLKLFVLGGFVPTPTPPIEPTLTRTPPPIQPNPFSLPLSSHPQRDKVLKSLLNRHNILIINDLHTPWNYN